MRSLQSLLLGSTLLLVPLCVHGTTDGRNESVLEFEAPPEASQEIGENLWFGADVVGTVEYRKNLDLDSGRDDHLLFFEPEIRAVLSYAPSTQFRAYGEFQFDGRAFLSKGSDNEEQSEGHLRIEQIYFDLPRLCCGIGLRVGRQEFEDAREWWFDEKIDAVKAEWRKDKYLASATVAREKLYGDDLIHSDTDEQVEFYILSGGFFEEKWNQLSLILVKKTDLESGKEDDPVFFGIQRLGEAGSDIRYWLNAAAVRGKSRGRKLRAYGVDSGLSVRFDGDWRPFITLGLAYGSGDDDLSDGEDGNFRQTGLQDNEARTYGITSYNYYGEVIDLELSNMWVGTLGIGIRPHGDTSAELLYHHYLQAESDDELFDSDLEVDPNGDHRGLGQEIDFVAAYRPSDRTKLSLVLGVFFPGDAFPDGSDPALLARVKFSYRF